MSQPDPEVFTVIKTEIGNFVVHTAKVWDTLELRLSGRSFGDHVAATAVFFVADMDFSSVDEFNDWGVESSKLNNEWVDDNLSIPRSTDGSTSFQSAMSLHESFVEDVKAYPRDYTKAINPYDYNISMYIDYQPVLTDFFAALAEGDDCECKGCMGN